MGRPSAWHACYTACCLLVCFHSAYVAIMGSHLKDRACPVCLTGMAGQAGRRPAPPMLLQPVHLQIHVPSFFFFFFNRSLVCSLWVNEAIVQMSSSKPLTLESVWNTGSVRMASFYTEKKIQLFIFDSNWYQKNKTKQPLQSALHAANRHRWSSRLQFAPIFESKCEMF